MGQKLQYLVPEPAHTPLQVSSPILELQVTRTISAKDNAIVPKPPFHIAAKAPVRPTIAIRFRVHPHCKTNLGI